MKKLTLEQIEKALSGLPASPASPQDKAQLKETLSSHIPTPISNTFFMGSYRIASIVGAVVLLVGGTGLYTLGNPEVTRASVLYPLKQLSESVDGALALSPLDEVEHHMDLAEQRAEEAAVLADDEASDELISETLEDMSEETDEALDAANEIDEMTDALEASTLITDSISSSTDMLDGLPEGTISEILQQLLDALENVEELTIHLHELDADGVIHVEINIFTGEAKESDDEDPSSGTGSEPAPVKVTVCHKDKNDLSISENAVDAHLRHGDTVGACPPPVTDVAPSSKSVKENDSRGNDKTPPGQLKKVENNVLKSTPSQSTKKKSNNSGGSKKDLQKG